MGNNMKGKTLSCLMIFILFIGTTLLPATLATEKEATTPNGLEPLDQGFIYTGFITRNTWKDDDYEGYTFVRPIFVTDGYSLFTMRNCEGIGIPDDALVVHGFFILRMRTLEVMVGRAIILYPS